MRLSYSVPAICRVLAVSASGYYTWQNRPPSRRAREDMRLEVEIRAHKRTRETFGPERLQHDLAEHGVQAEFVVEGWLYLAGHKDLFNGEVVGYAMAERMTKNLVSEALFRAVSNKRPAKGLIHHSDRGASTALMNTGDA